jgi:hypothetical protein
MVKTTQYLVRSGNPITRVYNESSVAKDLVIFTFGVETSEVEACSATTSILESKDMCMFKEDIEEGYFSANFTALPGKVNNKVVFQANTVKNQKNIKDCLPPIGSGKRYICGSY